MYITIGIFANLLLFLSIFFYRRRARLKSSQWDPFSFFLLIALVQTIVGLNFFLYSDVTIPFGLDAHVDERVIPRVYTEYYISWILTFILFGACWPFFRLQDRNVSLSVWKKDRAKDFFNRAVFLSLLIILAIDLSLIGDLPGTYILRGDLLGAELAKGRFIAERFESGIPVFGYLMQYFPIFAVAWAVDSYYSRGNLRLLFAVLFLVIVYSALTLIKSYALVPFIAGFAVLMSYSSHRVDFRFLLQGILAAIILIIIPFYLIFGEQEINLAGKIASRLFMVQIQGAILIRSIFDGWDLAAMLNGAPLLKRFGYETMDPAAQVLVETWGSLDNGFVNINSHYIGQGFVMFGGLISFVGPMIILLNFFLISLAARTLYIGNSMHVSNVIAIAAMALVPFNNNFGNAVYFKPLLAFLILTVFIFFLYRGARLISRISLKRH